MADVKTTAPKSPSPAPRSTAGKPRNSSSSWLNFFIVIACIAVGYIIYYMVLGNPKNFSNPEERKGALNFLGHMYDGGPVVGLLISTLLVTFAFIFERFFSISKATGKGNGAEFVRKVQYHLANKNIDQAIAECDKQKGSVGNVMKAGLLKYREMASNTELNQDEKVFAINAEVEEATALEMPMLEKNLVFLSTITSAATLIGLFGTVLGMIRAFNAMAQAGAPDATALAGGISEALYNTATGIGTSIIAMLAYNYFTTIIDGVKYQIDEGGFTLGHSFKQNYPA